MIRKTVRETFAFDWSHAQPGAALLCLPALALPLALGITTGHARQGMMVAAGAFSAGFGSFQELRGSRQLPMLVAIAGMCVSSWIGTLAGLGDWPAIVLTGVWGAIYGFTWSAGPAPSWIALQCVVWLVISTAYPAHGLRALSRGSFVLAGGLVQMLIVTTTWRLTGRAPPVLGGTGRAAEPAVTSAAVAGSERTWQMLRAGSVLAAGMALSRSLALPSGYWIPMTAAIVTRPALQQTIQRGLARIVGTLAGAAIATLIAFALRPLPAVLASLVVAFAAASYLLVYVNYAAFAACLTSYVVFLLALAGAAEAAVIAHRTLNTLVGGGIAWIGHVVYSGVTHAVTRRPPASRS
jgi:fusaric acid resistance family protein